MKTPNDENVEDFGRIISEIINNVSKTFESIAHGFKNTICSTEKFKNSLHEISNSVNQKIFDTAIAYLDENHEIHNNIKENQFTVLNVVDWCFNEENDTICVVFCPDDYVIRNDDGSLEYQIEESEIVIIPMKLFDKE